MWMWGKFLDRLSGLSTFWECLYSMELVTWCKFVGIWDKAHEKLWWAYPTCAAVPDVQFIASMTSAVEWSSCVDAFLAAATIVPFTLIDICREINLNSNSDALSRDVNCWTIFTWQLCIQLNSVMLWMDWPVMTYRQYTYIMEELIHNDVQVLELYYGWTCM